MIEHNRTQSHESNQKFSASREGSKFYNLLLKAKDKFERKKQVYVVNDAEICYIKKFRA